MLTIHKQQLELTEEQYIHVPNGSALLTVQLQNNIPCIWYICDTEKEHILLYIAICGTGDILHGDKGKYIATLQHGMFVWHVFYKEV